jgi:hypothetical protein
MAGNALRPWDLASLGYLLQIGAALSEDTMSRAGHTWAERHGSYGRRPQLSLGASGQ